MSLKIVIEEEDFVLHPSGVIYWETRQILLVADVHLGKITHFRKHGAPVPADAAHQNLQSLTEVVNHFQPQTIIFLGDLFHSYWNEEWHDFETWVFYTNSKIILIEGNHDIIPKSHYENVKVEVLDQLLIGNFILTHHPTKKDGYFNFSGHVHPGISLRGVGRQILNLPCFFKSKNGLILPAFGTFTGKHILKPSRGDEVFAIVDEQVICVTA